MRNRKTSGLNRREFLKQSTLLGTFGALAPLFPREDKQIHTRDESYLPLISSHFERMFDIGLDTYGPEKTGMWLASVDIRKGGQYEGITEGSRRVYRQIHAPRGSTIYWDQSTLTAAHLLTELTGNKPYRSFADSYIREFLSRCISGVNGFFLWGNHHYYDVFSDQNEIVNAPYHEIRPISPAWPLFWKINAQKTEQTIRATEKFHVYNPQTGEFDRHANTRATERPDGNAGYPFIEQGGILVESFCWLAHQLGGEPELVKTAANVAEFSFETRSKKTGLMRTQAGTTNKRWDYHAATTEIGLWARCLLRAADYAGSPYRTSFREMAKRAVAAYLRYGFDEQEGKFYGALHVEDGTPDTDFDASYSFRPGFYSDIWEPLFPTHDYPMSMAEACVDLYLLTGDTNFREGIQRWVEHVRNSLPADYARVEGGFPSTSVRRAENRNEPRIRGAHAGDYGRVIHFLTRAGDVLEDSFVHQLAKNIASEAVEKLYVKEAGMFRSNPERDTCDAVDEVGVLFLALLQRETGEKGGKFGFYI